MSGCHCEYLQCDECISFQQELKIWNFSLPACQGWIYRSTKRRGSVPFARKLSFLQTQILAQWRLLYQTWQSAFCGREFDLLGIFSPNSNHLIETGTFRFGYPFQTAARGRSFDISSINYYCLKIHDICHCIVLVNSARMQIVLSHLSISANPYV